MKQTGIYKTIKEPGAGGFRAAYLSEDPCLGVKEAIKVFNKDENLAGQAASASTDALGALKQRFTEEVKTLHHLSANHYVKRPRRDECPRKKWVSCYHLSHMSHQVALLKQSKPCDLRWAYVFFF